MVMQSVAWLAALMVFLSFFMKTIVPLRLFAIASNVVFIAYALLGIHYGIFDKVLPIFVLHTALLPLNLQRLQQIQSSVRGMKAAREQAHSITFLTPYMRTEYRAKGTVLFHRGDPADRIYVIESGHVDLPDVGKQLGPTAVFGEAGVFAHDARRTGTAVCADDCVFSTITADKVLELFYQEPRFGFFIVQAMAQHLKTGAGAPAAADPVAGAAAPPAQINPPG